MRGHRSHVELPGFRFSLQPVLDVKVKAEERTQVELADLIREMDRLHREAESLRARAAAAARLARQASTGDRLDVSLANEALTYSAHLRRQAERAMEDLAALNGQTDAKRAELVNAMREREVLDRLKESRIEEEIRKRAQMDARALDEMVVMRFGKGRSAKPVDDAGEPVAARQARPGANR